jgi:cellobiose epimerase
VKLRRFTFLSKVKQDKIPVAKQALGEKSVINSLFFTRSINLMRISIILIGVAGVFNACTIGSNTSETSSFEEREALASEIERSLRTETLAKWYPLAVDQSDGGFLSTFTYDFKPEGAQEKMIVSQARHTWVNAKASIAYSDSAHYRNGALHGLRFLKEKMWDQTYGGFYTLVDKSGTPIDSVKTAYGNAFGIYGLAALYAATKDTTALELARKAFLWLEDHSHDAVNLGYFQHLTRKGVPITRTSQTDSREETGYKDQNSSIHLLEAFTELYQVWPDPLVKERLLEMMTLIRDRITTSEGYLVLFFTPDWKAVSYRDSALDVTSKHHNLDHVSFGHDIETAYLLLEASHVAGVQNDTTTLRIAKKMVDHSLANGWDNSVGGFYDEGYYYKGRDTLAIIRDSKTWWAQAEAMNTLLIMADLFPEDERRYYEKFVRQWEYINKYVIDHEHGDWYWGGIDKEPDQKFAQKGQIWKATYHHYRSMENCIKRLRGQKE